MLSIRDAIAESIRTPMPVEQPEIDADRGEYVTWEARGAEGAMGVYVT